MDSLTWTHLCVCVSKTERLAMLVFSFSFLLHLANQTTLLILLLLHHACLVCLVLCWRTQISPLCLDNATTSSCEGRRGRFRCYPATDECQLIISWWLCSFLPLVLHCLWHGVIRLPPTLFLWSIVKITASQSLALSKVPHCIIHEFGNKRSLCKIPLSLMNFHRWISGLFGWLKLKFELLKQQGGVLELLCQEGWGRQHFIFNLIRTSL